MFLEQKPKSSASALPKLFLAAVILICFSVVLGVAGYLVKNKPAVNPELQFLNTSPIIATPTPIAKDEIVDWKTYRNEEYKFEFKYPKDYSYSPLEAYPIERTTGDNKKYSGLGLGQYDNGCNLSLFVTDLDKNINPFDETGFPEKASSVVGIKKMEFNKKIYHLGISVASHAVDVEKCISFFDQILSTFKFTEKDSSFSCGTSTATDIDNNIYNTVKIGEQCWLKENLKVTKNPEGKSIIRYCYDNDSKICETDEGLYDWNTTMNNSTADGAQGICPDGWHVPKDSEWQILESKFIGNKSERGIDRFEENFNSFNFFKTDAINRDVVFWSSTETNNTIAKMFTIIESIHGTYRIIMDEKYKTDKYYLRCLKD